MISVIHINIDPVLVTIGNLSIHWYGVMYVIAFMAGYWLGVVPYLTKRGFTREFCERALFWTIVFGLTGARLFFVVQQPELVNNYIKQPLQIIAVWQGGMAFYGAIIGGVTTIAVLAKRQGVSFWTIFDAGVIFAVIGQPIGRIGNVINGDILGAPSTLPWATAYDNPHAVLQSCCQPGVGYQPAAAYEALGTIVIGLFLYLLCRRRVANGTLGIAYVGAYAVSQYLLFYLRDSEPIVAFGLRQAQLTSIVMLIICVPALYKLRARGFLEGKPAEEVFAGSKSGDQKSASIKAALQAADDKPAKADKPEKTDDAKSSS